MPRISEFYGISIYMYWFDDLRHHTPHFHVRYGGKSAVFSLQGNCLEGNIGPRAKKLVREWAREKNIYLKKAWKKAINGKEIPWIQPLD